MSDTSTSAIHFSDKRITVLITGATGFIGKKLVAALLKDGHQVIALTRDPAKANAMFAGQVRCVQELDALSDTDAVDVVINLAGARILGARWSDRRKQTLRASRVGLTKNLVSWIANAQHKPALLLSGSAVGYYGIQHQDDPTPLAEDAPPQPIFMSQLCQEWEQAAGTARQAGVTVTCMRFGMVLGHEGALPPMMIPVRLGLGGPLGGGRQMLAWIHVEDVLRGMAHLIQASAQDRPIAAAYNFTAPHGTTQAEFTRTAARILHRPCLFPTPGFPVRLLLGEQADIVLEGQRAVPVQLQKEGFQFRYPTVDDALQALLR
ncbi:MAG: TIGR01777 family oxidoreductase [Oxalicibacterium faecigallinarum]|uniref:TIGR01777 family oxidoreductase n=1 Tax=Oxalicibacterium faecigallinarum TaxID=573741 RepID=UPI0028097E9B|nr:TIGR01777 family oxidoreductase [Oxalicibacterium faecigallinarum]MDQ7970404.1 TIGR01777 family oxidoreductase [Oxalicibacterium faecigallinarum]